MTPDHLHGYISITAMKKGKHVVIHKPIANRMYEARLTSRLREKRESARICLHGVTPGWHW